MAVHRKPIRLLCLLRWHQRVAPVRQRSGSIRCSIHMMLHIRPRKGRRDVGRGEWQGEQEDPETAEHNPRQQEEEDESVHRWLLCYVQSPFSYCGSVEEGSEPGSRRRVGSYPAPSRGGHLATQRTQRTLV